MITNDVLDHIDGIVAKAQRQIYGNIDSPLLGAFVDAFCDKVCNIRYFYYGYAYFNTFSFRKIINVINN